MRTVFRHVLPSSRSFLEGDDLNATTINGKPRAQKAPPKTTSRSLRISDETIENLSEMFKLLADKSRLKILLALAQQGEMHVSALCDILGQSQPAVSHHLTLMRGPRLVGYRRDGKHNFYHVNFERVSGLLERFFADSGPSHQLHFDEFSLAFKKR
jgi:ArsR family transcriptional regulator